MICAPLDGNAEKHRNSVYSLIEADGCCFASSTNLFAHHRLVVVVIA
ncbi:hypothetical protein SynBIOSE41_02739 [Synechococcus sp. BIOS-E4-1]|nr:hypothetical protein SynBIOSE41_02739 [Synechococcus sp. BIOS-E4-1]